MLIATTEISLLSNDNNIHNVEGEIFCHNTVYPDVDVHSEKQRDPLYVFKTTADPYTIYLHEAMKQKYCLQFRIAMQNEIDDRMEDNKLSVVHKSQIPPSATLLPAVW